MDFDFYHDDPYCTNDFAKFFTRQDLPENDRDHFDFLTAFEVLEHFENPMEEIGNLLQLSDAVFVTTELLPEDKKTAKEIADWHYIGAEAGQHIGFFTKKALEEVGKNITAIFIQMESSSLSSPLKN